MKIMFLLMMGSVCMASPDGDFDAILPVVVPIDWLERIALAERKFNAALETNAGCQGQDGKRVTELYIELAKLHISAGQFDNAHRRLNEAIKGSSFDDLTHQCQVLLKGFR